MTTTAVSPAPASFASAPDRVAPAVWAPVAEGLWVGTRDGEFLGTVEFAHGGFQAADHHGTGLGRSHSLAAAKRMIDSPDVEEAEQVMRWSDERSLLVLGWLAFAASAVAAVSIATQFFV